MESRFTSLCVDKSRVLIASVGFENDRSKSWFNPIMDNQPPKQKRRVTSLSSTAHAGAMSEAPRSAKKDYGEVLELVLSVGDPDWRVIITCTEVSDVRLPTND